MGEIQAAKHLYSAGFIKKVLPIVLDSTHRSELPDWLLQFNISSAPAAKFAASKIRGLLLEQHVGLPTERVCIGRDEDVGRLKTEFLSQPVGIPSSIFIAGARGIGRKTLLRKFLSDLFPKLASSVVEIPLSDESGEVDLFRALLDIQATRTVSDMASEVARFEILCLNDKSRELSGLVQATSAQGFLVLQGESAIVTDSGDLQSWIQELLRFLPLSARPVLGLVTKRFISLAQRARSRGTAFYHLRSLSTKSSKELFLFSLSQHTGSMPDQAILSALLDKVDGHPGQIVLAARLVAQQGVQASIIDQKRFSNLIASVASELLGLVRLDDREERLLGLLDEFGLLPGSALVDAFSDDTGMQEALLRLSSFGIVEEIGAYFRIAPFLLDVFRDIRRKAHVSVFLKSVRKKFVEELKDVSPGDLVPIEYLDSRISAAIRDKGNFENALVSKAVMPSQLLRIARKMYDERNYELAADLSARALERRITLSADAVVEALRIKGLSHSRRGEAAEFGVVVDDLKREAAANSRSMFARRVGEFLSGFRARLAGDIDSAVSHFSSAYRLDGKQNLHILRELAQCLFIQGNLDDAFKHASAAHELAKSPPNPYVIDVLLEIVIKREGRSAYAEQLLSELEVADERAGTSFAGLRRADSLRSSGDFLKALELANSVIVRAPHLLKAYILRAEIYGALGKSAQQGSDIRAVKKLASEQLGSRDFRLSPRIAQAEVSMLSASGDFESAIRLLSSSKIPSAAQVRLKTELMSSIARETGFVALKVREWYAQQSRL